MEQFVILQAGKIRPYYDYVVKITRYQWENSKEFQKAWKKFDPSLHAYVEHNLKNETSVEVKVLGLDKQEVLNNVFQNVPYVDYEQKIKPPYPVLENEYENECRDAKEDHFTEYEMIKIVLGEEVLSTHDKLRFYTTITDKNARLKKFAFDYDIKIQVKNQGRKELEELKEQLGKKLEEEAEYRNANIDGSDDEQNEKNEQYLKNIDKEIEALKEKIEKKEVEIKENEVKETYDELEKIFKNVYAEFYKTEINYVVRDVNDVWKKGVPYYVPSSGKKDDLEKLRLFQEKYKKFKLKQEEIARYKQKLLEYQKQVIGQQVKIANSRQDVIDFLEKTYRPIPKYSSNISETKREGKAGELYNNSPKRIKV